MCRHAVITETGPGDHALQAWHRRSNFVKFKLNHVKTVPKLRIQLINYTFCTGVVVAPIGAVQVIQTHGSATAGGVHEASVADVDADVADLPAAAEKHQVTGRELAGFD